MNEKGSKSVKNNCEVVDPKKTGDFIRYLRKDKGMTQDDLGELVFISRKSVSKWETGISAPSLDMLERLSKVLGVSLEELIKGEFNDKSKNKKFKNNYKRIIMSIVHSKWFKIVGLIVGIIVFALLALYLISKANEEKVYFIGHDGDSFTITGGTLTLSKGKSFVIIGEIFSDLEEVTDETKFDVEIYYKDSSGEDVLIVSFKDKASMDLDNESYSYLKDIIGSKDYSNIYFKLGFRDDDGVEYKYELEMYVKNTKEGGGSIAEKQSEKRIIEIDLNFIFDMSSEELKKKYDGKKFKVDGTEWKVKYSKDNNLLEFNTSSGNFISIALVSKKINVSIHNDVKILYAIDGTIDIENIELQEQFIIDLLVQKLRIAGGEKR